MYKRIVAGTDLSKTARFATDRAAALAKALGAEVILVHAGEDPGESFEALGKGYDARTVATPGNPAEVLLSECDRLEADLLVVGSVGMSGARRFLLGSVPNKVSHHSTRDLLIVKTDPPPRDVGEYTSMLVGTDGSPTATLAVKKTAGLAAQLGISPLIVCAYEPLTEHELDQLRADPQDPVAQWKVDKEVRGTPEEFRWRLADAAQAEDVLERASDHATAQGAKPQVRAVQGNAADVLITIAKDEGFDVVAVGSVGMSGPRRFMLGNVPHRISHHAPTDVLILHTT